MIRIPQHLTANKDWKAVLRQNLTRLEQLTDFLELDDEQKAHLLARPSFAINVPLRLAKKIAKGTLEDPILRQFVPFKDETIADPAYLADPVGDCGSMRTAKLLHKYEGRVLLVCTSACAMHCRYCFRQHYDYAVQEKSFAAELEIIAADPSIHEVILSGGDPLSLSDARLAEIILPLNAMPHIKRIRFHTRFPIGIPERIDESFLALIQQSDKQVVFVIHVNHARELDADIIDALKALQRLGCMMLNQSVLLKGVNDNVGTLKELCETLADNGVVPYYLHQLDRVQGAAHFEVEEEQGRALVRELAKVLPGYAVPKYVREIAGEPSKTLL